MILRAPKQLFYVNIIAALIDFYQLKPQQQKNIPFIKPTNTTDKVKTACIV